MAHCYPLVDIHLDTTAFWPIYPSFTAWPIFPAGLLCSGASAVGITGEEERKKDCLSAEVTYSPWDVTISRLVRQSGWLGVDRLREIPGIFLQGGGTKPEPVKMFWIFFFFFSSVQPWLAWNSPCRLGLPQTQESSQLLTPKCWGLRCGPLPGAELGSESQAAPRVQCALERRVKGPGIWTLKPLAEGS